MLLFILSVLIALIISIGLPYMLNKLIQQRETESIQEENDEKSKVVFKTAYLTFSLLFVSFMFFLVTWEELYFPSFVVLDIEIDMNKKNYHDIYNLIKEHHGFEDDEAYFNGELTFYLDQNGEFIRRGDFTFAYIDDDEVCNTSSQLVPESGEIYIPVNCYKSDVSVDTVNDKISVTEGIDLLAEVDIQSAINLLGSLSTNGYYEFGINDGWFGDLYNPGFRSDVIRLELFNDGTSSELNEENYDETVNYFHVVGIRFEKVNDDDELSYESQAYVVYYIDLDNYNVD